MGNCFSGTKYKKNVLQIDVENISQVTQILNKYGYNNCEFIGQGSYSVVYKAQELKDGTDFGLSHMLKNPELQSTEYNTLGNIWYQSPEVQKSQKPYTLKADVFSIGVVVLEALLQKDMQFTQIFKLHEKPLNIAFPNIENNENKYFIQNILSRMVIGDPGQRLDPKQLLDNMQELIFDKNQNFLDNLNQPPQVVSQQEENENKNIRLKISNSQIQNIELNRPSQDVKCLVNDLIKSNNNSNKYEENVEIKYKEQQVTDLEIQTIQKKLSIKIQKIVLKFLDCKLSGNQFKRITIFLESNHSFEDMELDFSFNNLIAENLLCNRINLLKYQQDLVNLSLWMNSLDLTSTFINDVSSNLQQLEKLKYFALDFSSNTSDYNCIKKMIDQLCFSNHLLNSLTLIFQKSKKNIFDDINQIQYIFSELNKKKNIIRFMFDIKSSWNKQLINNDDLEALKKQQNYILEFYYYD
ncbi:hypothetical protein ABPG72_020691 [Tetrahymena utriculariae]